MKINYLTKKIAWFGKYSGYECLPNYLPVGSKLKLFASKKGLFRKLLGKLWQISNNWRNRSPEEIFTDMMFLNQVSDCDVAHILYLESHIHILSKFKSAPQNLFGTIHLPIGQWKPERLQLLRQLKNIIILYNEEVEQFKKHAPQSTFHVIKHGVDLDFFKPLPGVITKRNKVLIVGHYLRNFKMLFETYTQIMQQVNDPLEFHCIIPGHHRTDTFLKQMAANKNVFFHEKLSDEELLAHYQDSNVMLLPMDDSGANTAIVQAIAVGLPVITTDIGGIRSYGGGQVFPVVPNHDSEQMTALFLKYYNDTAYRNLISGKQRQYAVDSLDWYKVAKQHIETYKTIGA